MTTANLTILTPSPLTDPADRADLLDLIGRHLPAATPHRFGVAEPLKQSWTGPGSAAEFWAGTSVFWRGGTKPVARGSVFTRAHADAPHSHPDLVLPRLPGPEAVRLLRELAVRFGADYGHLHALTDAEFRPRLSGGVMAAGRAPYLYVTPYTLQKWLPELYWGTVFGPPYVRLIGADVLRSTPAHEVAELAPDLFYVQLTERLSDVGTAPETFAEVRAQAVKHLGADLFFDQAAGERAAYRAAVFG